MIHMSMPMRIGMACMKSYPINDLMAAGPTGLEPAFRLCNKGRYQYSRCYNHARPQRIAENHGHAPTKDTFWGCCTTYEERQNASSLEGS